MNAFLLLSLCKAYEMTNSEAVKLDSLVTNAFANQCPTYTCGNQITFENLVFCQKNNIDDPFQVQLKDCANNKQMSNSDFWGNIGDFTANLYCHHQLNRCMPDAHVNIVDKLPGDTCINNYECLSKRCDWALDIPFKFC